jgi:mycothiol synthase
VAVQRLRRPDAGTVKEILALVTAAAEVDGAAALNEETVLRLRHGDPAAVHLLERVDDAGQLRGYAGVSPGGDGPVAELVVHPAHRRRGVGRALLAATVDAAADLDPAGRLRVWAHGDHPGAAALAAEFGFSRVRVLLQLRRSLAAPLPDPVPPPGVRLRTFRPGEDDHAWLALNARAFADHPEQGRWTVHDLRQRMSEPWFDPDGFFLAEQEGRLVGFHWTKVHAGDASHPPIGEVYVLGVDPSAHGRGLGATLALAGLRYLRERGLAQVMLYVDESNAPAVALYTRLGFRRWSADVAYARPA